MTDSFVSLKHLAHELKIDRSQLRKYLIRNGFKFGRFRSADSRGQVSLGVSAETAAEIFSFVRQNGNGVEATDAICPDEASSPDTCGLFYAIQMIPEFAPCRIKLGYTDGLAARLAGYRTAAPTLHVLQTWPCLRIWERAAIHSVTRVEAASLSNEVFDFTSVDSMIERVNAFFALMPDPKGDI